MLIPARILRKHAMDVDPTLRLLTPKEEAREERILTTAAHLITRFGAAAISFTNLAIAIKIAPSTMRRHFADFDALLGEIMRRHLQTIAEALGAVPRDAPDRPRLQRAAYIEATRGLGAPTAAHFILATYRTILPDDERDSINAIREQIGIILAGADGEACLHLLDCPCYDIDQIERMLSAAFCHEQPATAPDRPAQAAQIETTPPNPTDVQSLKDETAPSRISFIDHPAGLFTPLQSDTPPALRRLAEELRRLQVQAQAPPQTIAA